MLFNAWSSVSWPEIHAVMSVQNVPAPTAPGIWSEPSKRNDVDWLKIAATSWVIGSYSDVSKSL